MSNMQNAISITSSISTSLSALSNSMLDAQALGSEAVQSFIDDNGGSPPPDPKRNSLTAVSHH